MNQYREAGSGEERSGDRCSNYIEKRCHSRLGTVSVFDLSLEYGKLLELGLGRCSSLDRSKGFGSYVLHVSHVSKKKEDSHRFGCGFVLSPIVLNAVSRVYT